MVLRRLACRLLRDTRASVALETAIILPVAFLLLVGSWETYAYMRAAGIVERTAFTLGDLIARKSTLIDDAGTGDGDTLGSYYEAAREVARPLDLERQGALILTAIVNHGGGPVISWQRRAPFGLSHAASRIGGEGGPPVLPADSDFGAPPVHVGDVLIVAEVFHDVSPFAWSRRVWSDAPGQVTLYRRALFLARYGGIETLAAPGAPGS